MKRSLYALLLLALSACAPRATPASPVAAPASLAPLLQRVNAVRQLGYDCGPRGVFGPAPPVVWNARLERAALEHSRDMAAQGLFSHSGSDGSTPAQRVERSGYAWSAVGETLAYGGPGHFSPSSVIDAWLGSPGHCATLLEPDFAELGAAVVSAELDYWTLVMATPTRP